MAEKRHIRIGNQTSSSALPVISPFEYAIAHGFDAFEWFPDKKESGEGWSVEDLPKDVREVVRKTADAKDISLSVHSSLKSNPLNTAACELCVKEIEFAMDIGAKLFNIHYYPDRGVDYYVECIIPIIKSLSETGIRLSIENTLDTTPEEINALFKLLRSVESIHIPQVGMCLDIGHANLCWETRNDYLRYIDLISPEVPIIHMHMHENYGDRDSHLTLFTGPAGENASGIEGVIKRLKEKGFSGSIILEQWPYPAELLDNARVRLSDMIAKGIGSAGLPEIGNRDEKKDKTMIIYNLFPLLAGKFPEWDKHFRRASEMGFNWIFINPIQLPGSSGSIYSIKDYFSFNPILIDEESGKQPLLQVRDMIKAAEQMGVRMMIDLVINHCAADSDLITKHPEWFLWENGKVSHPFAIEKGKKTVWQDLAKFDHSNTRDKEGLFNYFLEIVKFFADLGFKGFRCDAAYQIPKNLWERLITAVRKQYPDLIFLAETLGTTPDLTRKTASAGFDYIFNSSKWWDFSSQWLIQQYNLTRDISPSISFPESHDTVRLCEELNGSINGLKQRYLFSALFSAGVMIPMGFEFGFRKQLHVIKTKPEDWEETDIDITSFISAVNKIKSGHIIFQEDAPTQLLHSNNPIVLLVWKASLRSSEESLFILNKDIYNRQNFYTESIQKNLQAGAPLIDISPEYNMDYVPLPFSYELMPGQGIVLITSRDALPAD
ncbi:MAG: TIM barrel protein [Dissulfurispiraceae bacterium]